MRPQASASLHPSPRHHPLLSLGCSGADVFYPVPLHPRSLTQLPPETLTTRNSYTRALAGEAGVVPEGHEAAGTPYHFKVGCRVFGNRTAGVALLSHSVVNAVIRLDLPTPTGLRPRYCH